MTTHSSITSWRISRTEELGRLQSMGLQRVSHDWSNLARARTQNAEERKKEKVWANLRMELFFLKENVKEQKKRNYINSKLKPFKRTPATRRRLSLPRGWSRGGVFLHGCLPSGPLISPSFFSSLFLCPLSFSLPSSPPLPFSSSFLLCLHFSVVVRKPDFMQVSQFSILSINCKKRNTGRPYKNMCVEVDIVHRLPFSNPDLNYLAAIV